MTLHRHKICGYTELAGLDDAIPGSNEELGDVFGDIIGAIAPIAGGALGTVIAPGIGTALGAGLGSAVGGAVKGKKHKGGGGEANLPAIIAGGITAPQVSLIVRELLSSVPPPVKEQVLAVIRAVQAEGGNMKHAEQALVSNIEAKFMPAINLAVQALKRAHTQRTATSEHRGAMKDAKRWDESRRAQRIILKRLATLAEHQASIDARLGGATILPKSKATYLGGKRLVDLLARKR